MKKYLSLTAAFATFLAGASMTSAVVRINVPPANPGGTLHWHDTGVWTDNVNPATPPTADYTAPYYDVFVANQANMQIGRDNETVDLRYLKIGALGNAGSLPTGLYTSIFNPNGTVTITGGSLTVSTQFNLGDADPYELAFWTDPIVGRFFLKGGTVTSAAAVYVGMRRGDLVHGGRTEGYFEQTGGTLTATGAFTVGGASGSNNKENVNGEARFLGGTSTLAGIYVGALPLTGGTWTDEQLAGRGHGRLVVGASANVSATALELRSNSELVIELGASTSFNPITATKLYFYAVGKLTIDGTNVTSAATAAPITLINYTTLTAAARTQSITFTGFAPEFQPVLEFQDDKLVLTIGTLPSYTTSIPPTLVLGESATLEVTAQGTGPFTYQWKKDGVDIPDATSAQYVIAAVSDENAGVYTVDITNAYGTTTTTAATVTVQAPGVISLSNISVRATMVEGQTLIMGFVVADGSKDLLVRGGGPVIDTLHYEGLTGLADPHLSLFDRNGVLIDQNDNWSSDLAATFSLLGATPFTAGSKDAALLRSISGIHTAHTRGSGSGTVLMEVYDAGGSGRIVNLSARYHVGTGDDILIAGLVTAGSGTKQYLIRGVGPGLAKQDVTDPISDPKITLHDRNGAVIAENDNWADELAPTFDQVGAFMLDSGSKDAALLVTLEGDEIYTVHVSGVDGVTGEGLVEVYEIP